MVWIVSFGPLFSRLSKNSGRPVCAEGLNRFRGIGASLWSPLSKFYRRIFCI